MSAAFARFFLTVSLSLSLLGCGLRNYLHRSSHYKPGRISLSENPYQYVSGNVENINNFGEESGNLIWENSGDSTEREDFGKNNEIQGVNNKNNPIIPANHQIKDHGAKIITVDNVEPDNKNKSTDSPSSNIKVPSKDNEVSSSTKKSDDKSSYYDELFEKPLKEPGSTLGALVKMVPQLKKSANKRRIPFPPSISEPRSTLEVYTDHFSHPDQFLKIADMKNERERIVQVVRWYLSSFHISIRSTIAQLPLTPVLGENFRCYWDIPGYDSNSEPTVKGSPVPWAKRNQLVYIAENVSQEPYVNAFYAEHYNKRISFTANLETDPVFNYGGSLTIRNAGKAFVHVVDPDEVYSLTFPNMVIRSLLTTPSIEIGDDVTIICEKTKYRAKITFKLKPLFGGDYNKIQASISGPDHLPFVSITGKWNSIMHATWSDGRTEEFVDVNNLPTIKKTVRSISDQEDNESRQVWKDLIAAIRSDDEQVSKSAKKLVFEKQDEKEKQRKKEGVVWKPRFFQHKEGEEWMYNSPLVTRLSSEKK